VCRATWATWHAWQELGEYVRGAGDGKERTGEHRMTDDVKEPTMLGRSTSKLMSFPLLIGAGLLHRLLPPLLLFIC
jgi:hypothetical protein